MLATILAALFVVLTLILSLIPYALLRVMAPFVPNRLRKAYLQRVSSVWSRYICALALESITIEGLDKLPERNALFVGNHQSYFDIPLLLAYVPRQLAFIAKTELDRVPILNLWMKAFGGVLLNRSDIRQSYEAINRAIASMETGQDMVIFPEGTRSRNGQVATFKKGSLKMALKADVPIVPFTLDGSGRLYEYNSMRIRKSAVRLIIHDPIFPQDLNRDQARDLADLVHGIVEGPILAHQTRP